MASKTDTPTDRPTGAIAWMARNPVTANLLMITLLFGGFYVAGTLKQEVFPDFEMDAVSVSVPYPGASPAEVERGIILAIEEAIRGLEGIDEISGTAREGGGTVRADLLLGADRQEVYQDVQQAVNRITTFPGDAEEPQVRLVGRQRRVITLVLYGDQTERVLRETVEYVRDDLLQDPSITQVTLGSVRGYEIEVSVSRDVLEEYGLTVRDVAAKIGATAIELPGGGIKTDAGEILLRVKERRDLARQFVDIPIVSSSSSRPVLLGEIAEVRDTFADTDIYATYNGKPAVLLDVYRVGEQTPLEVAAAARRHLASLNEKLPAGLSMAMLSDRSKIYRQRAELLLRNGAIGLVLVLLLLGIFLEARLAFWVMMGIPISFLGGFLFLPALDVSINMISMFAFLIALGIVVDDAIVVGENVYELRQRGLPLLQAAIRGAKEVVTPVTFSVLTNVVAFLPLFVVPGFVGKIWRVIPAVVCTVFMISLVECLFILPAHLGHVRDGRRREAGVRHRLHALQQEFSNWFMRTVRTTYGPFLTLVLRFRYIVVAIAVAVLVLTVGFVKGGRIALISMPRVDADFAVVTAVLPYGAAVGNTKRVGGILEAAAWRVAAENGGDKLVTGVFSSIGGSFRGGSGGHVLAVRAYLTDPDVRPISTRQFAELWREQAGEIVGLEVLLFESDRGGPGSGAAISVELAHADSATLDRAGADLAAHLGGYPVAKDIDDGFSPGKPQLDFQMLPEGESLGLTSADVARQVRSAFYGAEALRQQRGRDEVKVEVRLPESERVSENDIDKLKIRTPHGTYVPLKEVAELQRGRAYTSIERRDGRRTITVSANVTEPKEAGQIVAAIRGAEKKADGTVAALMKRVRALLGRGKEAEEETDAATAKRPYLEQLRSRYPGLTYSLQGRRRRLVESMESLVSGFVLAVIAIYVLLAIPFRSYFQPLIVMVSIPFGMVGAVIGHVIMGFDLSIISLMGIVALAGVVVNDSLILVDYANRARRAGSSGPAAIHAAGVRRFRPVMLTTLTTFGGLAPMIFESSRQARFMIPMAISLGFGILFATTITLVLVPSLYMITEDLRRKPKPGPDRKPKSTPDGRRLPPPIPAGSDHALQQAPR